MESRWVMIPSTFKVFGKEGYEIFLFSEEAVYNSFA